MSEGGRNAPLVSVMQHVECAADACTIQAEGPPIMQSSVLSACPQRPAEVLMFKTSPIPLSPYNNTSYADVDSQFIIFATDIFVRVLCCFMVYKALV